LDKELSFIENLKDRVEINIHRTKRDFKEVILSFLSALYGFAVVFRRYIYENEIIVKKKRLPKPVVSIGNFSVGGTGKTPAVISLAKKLQKQGFNVVVLSRGYKRKSKGTILVSDGKKIFVSWEEAGDEPYLIASYGIPVVVSSSRYKAGKFALEHLSVDIFLLDDGFQHYQLDRDIDIVLVDATKPFWEDELLPLGRLREPINIALNYVDMFLLTKTFSLSKLERERIYYHLTKYFKPVYIAEEKFNKLTNFKDDFPIDILKGKHIGVFSGLGNNQQFFNTMTKLSKIYNFCISSYYEFPDHHDYKRFSLPNVCVDFWITTEKDYIKLPTKQNILALKYEMEVPSEMVREILYRLKL